MNPQERTIIPKKILFILMPENFRDEEFSVPHKALTDAGHHVDVAGFSLNPAQGSQGMKHTPNLLLDKLSYNDLKHYDALVIPGGPGSPEHLWNNPRVQELITYFYERKKLVAAICFACVCLAQSGILSGKKATVYETDETHKIFREKNVSFVNEGCVILEDEHIITAQGPKNAESFAQAILVNL